MKRAPKFSIIVPVYNTEKYLKRCLDSIEEQTFTDYEVIIVNDGSTDNSSDIISKYPYKVINQKNQGLSMARNNGVKEAIGDYIIFLDSDDYIEKDLLKEISKSLINNPDLVRYQIKEVFDNKSDISYKEMPFENKNGIDAFALITKYHFVENAWAYAIKRKFYLKEKFYFKRDTYHEDFGLIPLVIIKSNIVNSISYVGYCYYQRDGSIMNNSDYYKTKKKVDDFYNHYLYLTKEINKTNLDKSYFMSFISNSLILKITELDGKDYKEALIRLKKDKVYDNLLDDSLGRRLKKALVKISPKLYYTRR